MVITLPQRNLESFLFSDDVIEALVVNQDKQDVLQPALDVKKQAIEKSVARGHPTDDLKSASGEIYIGLKRLLDLQRCGNTADAFMRDTLAQLVEPSMQTFQSLKTSIIDKVTH